MWGQLWLPESLWLLSCSAPAASAWAPAQASREVLLLCPTAGCHGHPASWAKSLRRGTPMSQEQARIPTPTVWENEELS